ncbi:MAG: 30S ribosome-binding factor RbfA [Miltoncostaeaceae bacterium]
MRRVDTALRQVVAEAIGRELSDPRLGFVTVTQVESTQDVREAKVYFTCLNRREREGALAALESARGLLQARVARELRTRQTPQLSFVYDSTQEDAVALTRLIDEVTGPDGGAIGAPAPEDPEGSGEGCP